MTTQLGRVAIMGGGCYGSFYLGQLLTARAKGAVEFDELLVVDHREECQAATQIVPGARLVLSDWNEFLDAFLDPTGASGRTAHPDMIVPTPLMPHLLAQWVERASQRRWPDRKIALVPADGAMGAPYDRLHTDGVRYVSFADWICPTHCVEPLLCPAIAAPRTWEMPEAVSRWSDARAATRTAPALFKCQHVAYGVGMYPAQTAHDALDAMATIVASPDAGELVVGSISSCHGAVAVLRVYALPKGKNCEETLDVLFG